MTPQDKANSIFGQYADLLQGKNGVSRPFHYAKQCSIIAVEEILAMCPEMAELYWQEVKSHLNQM